jgi:hypothetical protein
METALAYVVALFVRILKAVLERRKRPAEEAVPGAPPAPREAEAGWVRGGSLYRYVGRASTLSVVLPSLYTQQAAEERGPEGVTTYMTWADMTSPEFTRRLAERIRALRGEGRGARAG